MTALLAQAEELIRTATVDGGVQREPATRWYQLLQQAKGEEAEQIAFMGEALVVAARGEDDRTWVEGLLMGGPKEAKARLERLEMTQEAERREARKDADTSAPAAAGIDWDKVGREARVMVELNREAMTRWEQPSDES
jgi:hypothetical protein